MLPNDIAQAQIDLAACRAQNPIWRFRCDEICDDKLSRASHRTSD